METSGNTITLTRDELTDIVSAAIVRAQGVLSAKKPVEDDGMSLAEVKRRIGKREALRAIREGYLKPFTRGASKRYFIRGRELESYLSGNNKTRSIK